MKDLKVEERLIVATDYSPMECGGISGVEKSVLALAENLKGTGVYIKINSVLRAIGYSLIVKLHNLGLGVFADLKLIDIPKTMEVDAEMLVGFKPDILTVMCCAGIKGMNVVQKILGDITEILGVTILTSLDMTECEGIFICSPEAGVVRFARMAQSAGLGGLILSPKEVGIVKAKDDLVELSLNTPGIRPVWSFVEGDDQSRVTTPKQAIKNGADRIVVGRPITKARPNSNGFPQNPREAVKRTLEEIREGLEKRGN